MTDKPIIFSGPMVRAILDGRKTQTRRVLKGAPIGEGGHGWSAESIGDALVVQWPGHDAAGGRTVEERTIAPPYAPGDRLWVREMWSGDHEVRDIAPKDRPEFLQGPIWYWADGRMPPHGDWERPRPSIHMPRWASRLTITVTDVRVERVQDISDDDCEAEGAFSGHDWDCTTGCEPSAPFHPDQKCRCGDSSYQEVFARLWDSINGDRKDKAGNRLPYAWADNPWVVAVSFDLHRCNIDAMERA